MDKRITIYDFFKILFVFIVFTTHFIHTYARVYGNILWKEFPGFLLLGGVTGKYGVAGLAIISGYLCYNSKRDFTKYVIHRYLFFVISLLLIDFLFIVYNKNIFNTDFSFIELLKSVFLLNNYYYAALWFIKPFFISYIIISLNRIAKIDGEGVLCEILIFLLLQEVWISIGLMGNLYALLVEDEKLLYVLRKSLLFRILLLLIAWIIIKFKTEESIFIFFLDGVSCLLLILSITTGTSFRRLVDKKAVQFLGQYSWGFFLIHVLVYNVFGIYVFDLKGQAYCYDFKYRLILCYIFCIIINYLLAVPLQKIINCFVNKVETSISLLKQ